jgi:predicted nucleic acid-binding protein
MYLVDTSVWVDYLCGDATPQVRALDDLLSGEEIVGTAPIILQEILQGADSGERFEMWRKYFSDLFCYVPEIRWSRILPLLGFIRTAGKQARRLAAAMIAWSRRSLSRMALRFCTTIATSMPSQA